jgi:phage terminase large subunit-like protein
MPDKPKNYVAIAKRYAEGVVSGKLLACSWVEKACQRQLDDLARKDWRFTFDKKKANRICQFVEGMPHVEGEWAKRGEKLILQPWQCFIYTTVFGWVYKQGEKDDQGRDLSGKRRFLIAYNEMARKNGKSAMSAPIGIYLMCADGEMGAQVYSAATTREQAQIVWGKNAKPMVEREPGLREAFGIEVSAHSIFQTSTGSYFKALSAEGNSLDGLNTHGAIIDELHAHQTDKVYNVIESSRGSRLQPLIWIITTAGFDQSKIGFLQRNYVTQILNGIVQDETYFGIIYTLDDGDDPFDEGNWSKSNPNLGVSVYVEGLRTEALKASKMPSALNNYLTKRQCMWVNADIALFDLTKWKSLADTNLKIEDFSTDPCWIGVDLAPRHDFCSRVAIIRRDSDYYIFARHFLSEGEIEQSGNASYPGWAAEGWIETNEGETTSYDAIEEDLLEIAKQCSIQEVMYDPFTAKEILDHMQAEGLTMVEMRMSVQNLSSATKKLDALIAEGKIHHNGDPILAWMLSNVVGHYDRKDNVYPTKGPDKKPIDGAIALIMALARAMIAEETGSIYDHPEPIWIEGA